MKPIEKIKDQYNSFLSYKDEWNKLGFTSDDVIPKASKRKVASIEKHITEIYNSVMELLKTNKFTAEEVKELIPYFDDIRVCQNKIHDIINNNNDSTNEWYYVGCLLPGTLHIYRINIHRSYIL